MRQRWRQKRKEGIRECAVSSVTIKLFYGYTGHNDMFTISWCMSVSASNQLHGITEAKEN